MNTQNFFSIIIPTYNRLPFLKKALGSVLTQTHTEFELVIIDDGSTDGTKEFLSKTKDKRILYYQQKNAGVSKARNQGLKRSSGELIAFLDSDDWWLPNKLEITSDYMNRFPDISIFHTEETWFRGGKLLNQKKIHKKPDGRVYQNSLPLCCISISTVVIRKEVFNSVGIFDEDLEACEDYDFWLRAANKYDVKLIPEYLTEKEGGRADQLSSCTWGMDRFRIKALEKMLDSGDLSQEDYLATEKVLKKKCSLFAKGAEKRGKSEVAEYYRKIMVKYGQR